MFRYWPTPPPMKVLLPHLPHNSKHFALRMMEYTYAAANPMIAQALANGEDATGLCTVRELAQFILERGQDSEWLIIPGPIGELKVEVRIIPI